MTYPLIKKMIDDIMVKFTYLECTDISLNGDYIDEYGKIINWELEKTNLLKLIFKFETSLSTFLTELKLYYSEDVMMYERNYTILNYEIDSVFESHITFPKPEELDTRECFTIYLNVIDIVNNSNEAIAISYRDCFKYWSYILMCGKENLLDLNQGLREIIKMLAKENGHKNENLIDDESLLDPDLKLLFFAAEKKALGESGKFDTDIRCAAFCEIAYDKKYISHTKTRQKTMISFAKIRYGRNIRIGLSKSKSQSRISHKTRKVNSQPPLNKCF